MPRALPVCFTIVAAFQLHLAAASPVVEDAPVGPAVAALAVRLELDPARDRARFIAEAVRLLYALPENHPPELIGRPSAMPATPGARPITIPVPLTAATWSRAIFKHTVPVDQLLAYILSDRRAALLCRGLAGVDDATLDYLSQRPDVLTYLYEHGATVFAAFGGDLRIRDGRVVPPGGDRAVRLWEALARESVGAPDRFIRALFTENSGRLAYLYDAIASTTPAARAFALGLWIADEPERLTRFQAFEEQVNGAYHEWRPDEHPFSRPLGDLGMLLLRIRVDPSGRPAGPSSRAFWSAAFDVRSGVSGESTTASARGVIDAAWLTAATGNVDMYSRLERLDVFAFAQRAFPQADTVAPAETAQVLQNFHHYRMLLLTLERMGIDAPATYAAAVQRAAAVTTVGAGRRFSALAAFQGSLALIARMQRAQTIDGKTANALVVALCAVPFDGEYRGGLADWLRRAVAPRLPAGDTWEARVIAALAGPVNHAPPHLFWEGQAYRVDVAQAERERLEIVRQKQGGYTVDLALTIDELARSLRQPSVSLADVRAASAALGALISASGSQLKNPAVVLLPPGVDAPRDALDRITEASRDLARITRPADIRRAARVGTSLEELGDLAISNTLLSFAYAADLGDPESPALLAGNVAMRHDFGIGRKDSDGRARLPWALPRQDFQPGVPWHITGSLLGLDVALAQLNLRRLAMDRIADAPRISSIEREALAVGVSLMDSRRLTNQDRDAITAAVERGQTRVKALLDGSEPLEPIADALGFDGWRTRAVAWAIANAPDTVPAQFSLVDLLSLGDPGRRSSLDAWGTSSIYLDGCLCTKLPDSRAWRILEGRPQLPMMAATMGDLPLAVAMMMHDLNVPAPLARAVLSVGMQDFIDEMNLETSDDWWGLSRQAQAIRRQRVEDYVSAAAAVNGPLVPVNSDAVEP